MATIYAYLTILYYTFFHLNTGKLFCRLYCISMTFLFDVFCLCYLRVMLYLKIVCQKWESFTSTLWNQISLFVNIHHFDNVQVIQMLFIMYTLRNIKLIFICVLHRCFMKQIIQSMLVHFYLIDFSEIITVTLYLAHF